MKLNFFTFNFINFFFIEYSELFFNQQIYLFKNNNLGKTCKILSLEQNWQLHAPPPI